ncbi:MAG: hypothetical protein V4510_10115 [bacterium]
MRKTIYGPLVNASAGAWASKARKGVGKHLEVGIVSYDNDDGSKTTYLLPREAIDKMRPTAAGKPVVGKTGGFDHVKVQPGKKYDGQVTDGFWDGESGWESINFGLDNAETAQACEKGFQFSCAYVPTEVDETPGKWHNVDYDAVILNGEYTHFAVVPNPRYVGATIQLLNSLPGGVMNKVLKAALSLVPLKDLREVFNSIEDDEKKKAADEKAAKENARVEKRAAAQASYDAAMKNASSDDDRTKAKAAFEKMNAEIDAPEASTPVDPAAAPGGAPAADLPPQPLGGGDVIPEPGMPPMPAPGGAGAPTNAAPPETPEQAQEREKKAAEAAALKNAEDDAAKKKAAEEKAKKDEAEKQNAIKVKAEAAKAAKAEALRTERFNALRRSAEERGGSVGTPFVGIVSAQEREDLGRARYGSHQ